MGPRKRRTATTRRYDWRAGRHSGVPVCCIAWWIVVDDHLPWSIAVRYRRRVNGRRGCWGYIPCPACLLRRRRVPVHICTIDCRGNPGAAWWIQRLGRAG